MSEHSPLFQEYAAKESDFAGYGVQGQPQAPGIASLPPQQPVPEFGGTVAEQLPAQNPMVQIQNDPLVQLFGQWKGSSAEKRKTAMARISQDFANPLVAGFPYDASVLGNPKEQEGKAVPDPSSWEKFMKFIDGNPQFLLDLGAKLLAPRPAGTSQFGNIAGAYSGAMQRLEQRKAAAAKTKLAAGKTTADTLETLADTSKVPSEIALNKANAIKALKDAEGSTKKAAKVQLKDSIRDDLWAIGEGVEYQTLAEAGLAAQQIMDGTASIELKAYYDNVKENAFIAGTPAAIQGAELARKNAPQDPLTQLQTRIQAKKLAAQAKTPAGIKAAEAKQVKFMEALNYDREKIADYLASKPQYRAFTREQLLAGADVQISKVRKGSGGVAGKKPKRKQSALERDLAKDNAPKKPKVPSKKRTAQFAVNKLRVDIMRWKRELGKSTNKKKRIAMIKASYSKLTFNEKVIARRLLRKYEKE